MTEQGKPSKPLKTPKALAGRYQVLERLGEGAMGETWRARQTADGSAEVVIKALKLSRVDDWKAVELFEREAKALKGLDIEGVPRLIEFVRDEGAEGGARFYIVQSRVPGQTVAAMMAEGHRFTEAEVVNLGWQVAQVLGRLHARKPPIIHRDIKPSNVMVRPDGGCALIDFGAVTDASGKSAAAEGGETVVGTFGYMPPEQLRGRATPASDLYALGATMVHMLSGRAPASMPSKVFRLEFRPFVKASEPLLALLERLLEPDESERLGSAEALVEALEAVAKGPTPKAKEGAGGQPLVPVARTIGDLKAVGQPGHLALFNATPAGTPRTVVGAYNAAIAKHVTFWVIGGGVLIAALLLGLARLLRLDIATTAIAACMVGALVYFNIRQQQATRRLIAHGAKAEGVITAKTSNSDGRVEVRFSFSTRDNQTIRSKATFSGAPVLLERDAPVGVLYDPDQPGRCMLYPLPASVIKEVEP